MAYHFRVDKYIVTKNDTWVQDTIQGQVHRLRR